MLLSKVQQRGSRGFDRDSFSSKLGDVRGRQKSEPIGICQFLHYVLTFVLLLSTIYLLHNCVINDDVIAAEEKVNLQLAKEEINNLKVEVDDWRRKMKEAEAKHRSGTDLVRQELAKDCDNRLKKLHAKVKSMGAHRSPSSSSREGALQKQINLLREGVKKLSLSLIRHEFGDADTFLLEITVKFPHSMGEPQQEKIVVETAPVQLVPTGIYYFLTQVSLGLWDGASFIRNAQHVLQASARAMNGRDMLHSRFRGLEKLTESVPYQEYTDQFPHVKHTLGLAGRPGGPDFYISTIDNTKNHGPSGQASYAVKEEADVCFARLAPHDLANSARVVDRMHTGKVKPGNYHELQEYIGIESIRLLNAK